MEFVVGQRWISDTESQLGLGLIVAVEARSITVMFASVQEQRLYTQVNTPLTRVIFKKGDLVNSQEGWQLSVESVEEKNGLYTYIGQRLDTNESDISLREILLDHRICFSQPQDKLFAGQTGRFEHFPIRYKSLQIQHQQHSHPLRGLSGMRAGLIPHQLNIAHSVGQRHAPRVLLADEVGLGKTIEAGMIMHQQVVTGRASRILIVLPENLQHQWLVEMLRRFNLQFSLFDLERCLHAKDEQENPWDTQQFVICSLEFLCQHPEHFQSALSSQWDLLIVDEAHHLEWQPQNPSLEYEIIEALANVIPGVLLLTATPEQLGHQSHFARLRLLDPHRFFDYATFVEEEKQYGGVADAVNELLTEDALSSAQVEQLDQAFPNLNIASKYQAALAAEEANGLNQLHQQLVTQLMDQHGTGRILFRNTRKAIQGFPARQLHQITLEMPRPYAHAIKTMRLLSASIEEQLNHQLYPELLFQDVADVALAWWQFDPRVDWLIAHIKEQRSEKILVIAAHAQTALQIEKALREREGIRAAVFHEQLSLLERDRAAAYFAQEEAGAQVLICSEIGSEGRNFQFAHQMVMFDLPRHPDLLEQRIGRLDRIGQQSQIEIYLPTFTDFASAKLAYWYHSGLNAFTQPCPAADLLYQEAENLFDCLIHEEEPALISLTEQSAQRYQQLQVQLENGRDKLLEIQSHGGEAAQQLTQDITKLDDNIKLITFAFQLFDTIGLDQDDLGENVILLKPSEHMLIPDYPGIPADGVQITFDRQLALSREDLQFLTWEHPIIQQGIEAIFSEQIGNSAVALLKNKSLPVGTLLLECIFRLEAHAATKTGIMRFLPPTPIRLLIDQHGNNLAPQVDFDQLNAQLVPCKRALSKQLITQLQPQAEICLQHTDQHLTAPAEEIRAQALAKMHQHLGDELQRLQALQAVNPSVRQDEIDWIHSQQQTLHAAIESSQLQLDAIRLIVVTHQ